MCGIAGIIKAPCDLSFLNSEIRKMTAELYHRGPDSDGFWFDHLAGLGLGHSRLAILDLSDHGRQPMISACGRFVIALNGEIYNFKQIKEELLLAGYCFKSKSDSEVLLEAVAEWGFETALKKAAGMFAVAVYDNKEKILYLARDRIGEKPLYYSHINGCFLFASELKAINASSEFNKKIDLDALALYFRHNYIPAPYTIYKNISKLEPGTFLTVEIREQGLKIDQKTYWSLAAVVDSGKAGMLHYTEEELLNQFEELFKKVVSEQMVSDVPLGAFLSGGVDSSIVVSTMQSISNNQVKTFTIGFSEDSFDEACYAKAVARHLGTDHTELYISPEEALNFSEKVADYYDEPFADSSQIPTCLVAHLAKQQVTVSLSGDGGDELFGGYNNYSRANQIWNLAQKIPLPLRYLGAGAVRLTPAAVLDCLLTALRKVSVNNNELSGDRVKKVAALINAASREDLYRNLISNWQNPENVVLNAEEQQSIISNPDRWPQSKLNYTEWMMYIDAMGYLPDDILVKLDRACMAVSLESRIPLLDHRVIEFTWQLPFSTKIRAGENKWLLKRLLYRSVPEELFKRPKKGFSIPLDSWLRGPLKDWAAELLAEKRIRSEGFLNDQLITARWNEHTRGGRNWQQSLWAVLMFQAWFEKQKH